MHSLNLTRYLEARARGETPEQASALSGIGIGEALLHEKDIESGELALPRAGAPAREGTANFPAKNIPENIPEGENKMARDTETTIQIGDGPAVPLSDFHEAVDHLRTNSVAADQLRLFVERIERLEEEIGGLNDDKRDVYAEAKANGYDPKIMRIMVRLRKMETHTRQEQCALVETYAEALGLQGVLPL